jgi:hypothetical protein
LDSYQRVTSVHTFAYKGDSDSVVSHASVDVGPFDDLLLAIRNSVVESVMGTQIELPFEYDGSDKAAGANRDRYPAGLDSAVQLYDR